MAAEYRVLRHNVKTNLNNGIAWSIGFNFVLPFVGIMAGHMGANDTQYALLSSIPALLTIAATLPAAFLIEQFRHQKRIAAIVLFLSRICYLLLGIVPWLPSNQVDVLIYLVGVYTAMSSIVGVAWQAMMAELIPPHFRNRVFAQRNIWSGGVGMIVTLATGWGLDRVPFPIGYQVAYALGFVAALFETWYFIRLRIPSEEQPPEHVTPKTRKGAERSFTVKIAMQGKQFIDGWKINAGRPFYWFCASAVVFIFAWQAAWPIYLKVKVSTLHATNMWISIDTVAGALGGLLCYQLWARAADRWGNPFTVFVSALCLAMTPFFWIYAPSMVWASLYDFIGGAVTAGFNQSLLNRLLETVPDKARQRAIAIYTSLTQLSAIFAPIIGMQVYEHLSYTWTMAVIGCARIAGAFCFLIVMASRFQAPVIEPHSKARGVPM